MFKITYKYDPTAYFPTKTIQSLGNRNIVHGHMKMKERTEVPGFKPPVYILAEQIIYGLSKIYGFYNKEFISDNFTVGTNKWSGKKVLKYRHHICGYKSWQRILFQLRVQLDNIHKFSSFDKLQNSKYVNHIAITGRNSVPKYKSDQHKAEQNLADFDFTERYQFTGTVKRYGIGKTSLKPTLLLMNVKHKGQLVDDHVWLNCNHLFTEIGALTKGVQLTFDANVYKYVSKGEFRYGLNHISNIHRNDVNSIAAITPMPDTPNGMIGYILVKHFSDKEKSILANYMPDLRAYKKWLEKLPGKHKSSLGHVSYVMNLVHNIKSNNKPNKTSDPAVKKFMARLSKTEAKSKLNL